MADIHVMDAPRADPKPGDPVGSGRRRPLKPGEERTCVQQDRGEVVVFHPNAEKCGAFWRCPDCGVGSSGVEA